MIKHPSNGLVRELTNRIACVQVELVRDVPNLMAVVRFVAPGASISEILEALELASETVADIRNAADAAILQPLIEATRKSVRGVA